MGFEADGDEEVGREARTAADKLSNGEMSSGEEGCGSSEGRSERMLTIEDWSDRCCSRSAS